MCSSARITPLIDSKPSSPLWLRNPAAFSTILIALVTFATFLLTRGLGLVSDDFFLLVDNLKLPLTKSVDELHRPLRNILLHWLGATVGVRQVWPYRLLVAASYVAVLRLLFQLSRKLGSSWIGAWTAVLF